MRASLTKLASAVGFAGVLSVVPATAAESLRMGGTGAATEMLRQVGAGFTEATGIKIEVIASLGSDGALSAVTDNKLDMAVSGRTLTEKEIKAGLRQGLVLRTAFVFATSKRNPNGLKSTDLPRIFAEAAPTWDDGTPLKIILRPRNESDMALMGTMVAGMDAAIEMARRRVEVPVTPTDQDNVDIGERVPGSLIATTLTQLKTERTRLQVIPLDGIKPTLASFESGAYPFTKRLYFILGPNSAPGARQFVSYLQSPPGLKALRETDTLPGIE